MNEAHFYYFRPTTARKEYEATLSTLMSTPWRGRGSILTGCMIVLSVRYSVHPSISPKGERGKQKLGGPFPQS